MLICEFDLKKYFWDICEKIVIIIILELRRPFTTKSWSWSPEGPQRTQTLWGPSGLQRVWVSWRGPRPTHRARANVHWSDARQRLRPSPLTPSDRRISRWRRSSLPRTWGWWRPVLRSRGSPRLRCSPPGPRPPGPGPPSPSAPGPPSERWRSPSRWCSLGRRRRRKVQWKHNSTGHVTQIQIWPQVPKSEDFRFNEWKKKIVTWTNVLQVQYKYIYIYNTYPHNPPHVIPYGTLLLIFRQSFKNKVPSPQETTQLAMWVTFKVF